MATTKKQRQQAALRRRESNIRAVMESKAGRGFVWTVLHDAGVWSRSFTGEALGTAHAEGARSVGLRLMEETQRVARVHYVDMVAEAIAAERDELAARETEAAESVPEDSES